MQRSTAKRRLATVAPQAAIALNASGGGEERTRAGSVLVAFMRVVAAVWVVQGALQWASVLSTAPGGLSPFATLEPLAMAAAVFFAVVDFVAAVGLWMLAPWGGVIWLVAVFAQLLVIVRMPGFFDRPFVTASVDVVLVAIFLALLWAAAQASDATR